MATFLLIDDDPIFNFLHEHVIRLAAPGSICRAFTSSKEALLYLTQLHENSGVFPDHILLDINMPEVSGFDILEALNNMSPLIVSRLNVHMVTSSLDEKDQLISSRYPMVNGFYPKPLNAEKVLHLSGGKCKA